MRGLPGQRIKELGRRLLPPIVVDLLRPRRRDQTGPGFTGRFERYEDARRAASASGYENERIIDATVERTRQIRDAVRAQSTFAFNSWTLQNLAAVFVGLATPRRTPLRVLDFGGAMGVHYFTLGPLLGGPAGLDWTICETEATARAGRHHFADGPLKFTSTLEGLDAPFDAVLASGVLQYVESPADTLTRLAGLSEVLIINRVPLVDEPDHLAVQTAPGGPSYPAWFFSEREWLGRIEKAGLGVVMRWSAPDDTIVLEGKTVIYQGLVARRG